MRIDVAYSRSHLAVGDGSLVYLISLGSKPRLEYTFYPDEDYEELYISGSRLLLYYDDRIEARSLEDPEDLLRVLKAKRIKSAVPTYTLFSPDSSTAALYYAYKDLTLLLDLEAGKVFKALRGAPVRLRGRMPVIYSSKEKTFKDFTKEPVLRRKYEGIREAENEFLALLGEDRVEIINMYDRSRIGLIELESDEEILGAIPSPKGKKAILELFDGVLFVSLENDKMLEVNDALSWSVSPDEEFIVVRKENSITLYRDFEPLKSRKSKRFPRFSPSGHLVLEGKKSIVVYDPQKLKVLKIFKFSRRPSGR